MALHFVLGQPFRSLSLDLKADGCHWHPKSHVSLGLPLGCIKNFKIGTALGTVSHELVNHISTSSWILGRFTAKAHLGKRRNYDSFIMCDYDTPQKHVQASPKHSRTFTKPSPNHPRTCPKNFNHSSTLPMHPSSHRSFPNHCSILQNLPAPPKFPQRDWREHKKPLPGSPICASNKLKSVHECVMM